MASSSGQMYGTDGRMSLELSHPFKDFIAGKSSSPPPLRRGCSTFAAEKLNCSMQHPGAVAGAFAVSVSQPLDTVRVRIQQSSGASSSGQSRSSVAILRHMVRTEGALSPWKGLLYPASFASLQSAILFQVRAQNPASGLRAVGGERETGLLLHGPCLQCTGNNSGRNMLPTSGQHARTHARLHQNR